MGHTLVVDPAVAVSCSTDGRKEGVHCGSCGLIITEQIVIPRSNVHHYDDGQCRDCSCSFDTSGLFVLKTPLALKVIESEAFMNTSAQVIIVQDDCISIGRKAFAGCENLQFIFMPAKLEGTIPDDAFDGCSNFEIIFR